jgi:hypothetical protein
MTHLKSVIRAAAALLVFVCLGCGRTPTDALRPRSESVPALANPFPSDRGPVPVARPPAVAHATAALTAAGGHTPPAAPSRGTLVLYDDSGPYGWLGELYATAAVNLASHFGAWTARPVASYAPGDLAQFAGAVYIGSTYDQPLPVAFLDDVLAGTRPVLWMYDNIWQLAARSPDFFAAYGYVPWQFDDSSIAQVVYQGRTLSRYAANGSGVMEPNPIDLTRVTVLATAVRADGSSLPWALRSGNLTYIGEIPFAYIGADDRYLVLCDLFFDLLAPATAERHRALVRIEDVSADTDPTTLTAIAQYLASQNIPYSVAVIPVYTDPDGVYNGGVAQTLTLADRPALLSALQTMAGQGATLVMHGYTHQYSNVANPYTGVTADDF